MTAVVPPPGPEWWADTSVSSGSDDDEEAEHGTKPRTSLKKRAAATRSSAAMGITVYVTVNGLCEIPIACGRGDQSIKWLCMAAVQRYRASLEPSGRLRSCEPLSERASSTPGALRVHHAGGRAGNVNILNDHDRRFRRIRGNFVPHNMRLKSSLKKVAHHVNKMREATRLRAVATKAFFQQADHGTAAAAVAAASRAARETVAVRAKVGALDVTLSEQAPADVGLDKCHDLKRRGRAGSGNRVPNAEDKLRLHLQDGDSVFLELDETGGAYVRRDGCFSVSTFMRLRYVASRKGEVNFDPDVHAVDTEALDEGYRVYVRERAGGVADRNSKSQIMKNLSYLALEKFVPDALNQDALRAIFADDAVYDLLRTLFRQYAYNGAGDAFTMDVGEWEALCKDAGLLGTKGMTFGKVDTIFIAANYTAKAAKKDRKKLEGKMGKPHDDSHMMGNPDNAFTLFEFIEALCRLGMAMQVEASAGKDGGGSSKKKGAPSRQAPPALCVQALLDRHILPLAKKCHEEWHLFEEIEDEAVQNCFHRRMKELELKFLQFCPHMSTKKKSILDMHLELQQYTDLVGSSGLLREDDVTVQASITHRTIRECFIWAQRKTTTGRASVGAEENSLTELGFYEFLESLALMAHRVYAGHPEWTGGRGAHAEHLSAQLDALVDVLLQQRKVL